MLEQQSEYMATAVLEQTKLDRHPRIVAQTPYELSSQYFPTDLQQFQFYDKYSRYNYDLNRRETWVETVDRAVDFLYDLSKGRLDREDYEKMKQYILEMKVMPSMRLMAMAGPATERQNLSIYNCSFMGIDNIKAFGEALLISMSGCGVGYSVERKFVEKLPTLNIPTIRDAVFVVPDNTEGWQAAIDFLISHLYDGTIPTIDTSQIRPHGSILKIKGGRASGPEVLNTAVKNIIDIFFKSYANGQERLNPIQVHDIMCNLGQAAVSGGTRRTAMISLFDFDDEEMLNAKQGDFAPIRWNANNSMVWNSITQPQLLKQMSVMFGNGNGEPGIFSLDNAQHTAPERRNKDLIFGCNPCGEINLRSMGLCNLSAVITRAEDTPATLRDKIKIATIIGTIQSMATHFPGLRDQWSINAQEERLLGVDITGQMDNEYLTNKEYSLYVRENLKVHAIEANERYAYKLGINQSVAVTCVKPSGNTSVLVDCASGMHPRYAPYYLRRVRLATSSPIYKVLQESNFSMEPENGQTKENMTTAVLSFPVKAPEGAITRKDMSAIDMLDFWLENKLLYTEHNPSATIYYDETEQFAILNWLWDKRDWVGGITFLPRDDANYELAPYEEITEKEYEEAKANLPKIKWELLAEIEKEDMTNAAQELACFAGSCEIF